jgi:hypothetical protein
LRCAHRRRDVHNGFRRRIAHGVTWKDRMTFRVFESMRKNISRVFILLPLAFLIGLGNHRQRENE